MTVYLTHIDIMKLGYNDYTFATLNDDGERERERTRERDDIVALIMWENQSIRRNFEANSAPKQLKLNRMTE